MKKLTKIYKMSEQELKRYVTYQLQETHNNIITGDGYVFAQGTFPVLLVAHLDTVHAQTPTAFIYTENGNKISSPQGIGGDDRNGVFSVLEVIKQYNCSVLFCEEEERGGIGAEKFIKTDIAKELEFNYIIEFDRCGSNDAVFYDCDNPEFEAFITREFYETACGSFSDISVLAPFFGCAAVNLSCGYYKAHTKNEYVVVSEIENSINAACEILSRTTEEDKFEYIEAIYENYYYGNWNGSHGSIKGYYIIEYVDERGDTQWYDTLALSEEEAVGRFCIDNSHLSYDNIIDICFDSNIYA